jgi:DNA-binding XRE family transcriptional regulator
MKDIFSNHLNDVIRKAREEKYRKVKDFWEDHKKELKVSYAHYAAIESGKKYPDMQLAIVISNILRIDLKLCCHLWAKDHMPDAATRAFFDPIPGMEKKGIPANICYELDDYFVFSDAQGDALKKNPMIWDVLCFILSFSKGHRVALADIAVKLGLDKKSVAEAVEWLRNEGLVFSENGRLFTKRNHFHIPNTKDFLQVRNQNFLRISQDVVQKINPEDLANKEAYRTTFLRRLTRKQAEEICLVLDYAVGHLGNMDVVGNEYYGLTIAFGPRARMDEGKRGKQGSEEI